AGHNEPGGFLGVGLSQGFLGEGLITGALFPALDVRAVKLPALPGLVQTFEQSLFMLILGEIEPDFYDTGGFADQVTLKMSYRLEPGRPVIGFGITHGPYPLPDHGLMMTTVEGHHLAIGGEIGRHPPEKIMRCFRFIGSPE